MASESSENSAPGAASVSRDVVRLVTRLEPHHVPQLLELFQQEWWTRGRTHGEVQLMLEATTHLFAYCTVPDDRLVAFARVLTDGIFKAIVFDVIVAVSHRGEGLGAGLMNAIIDHPAIHAVRHLELYCLPDMVPFYEKWRFSTDVSGVLYMRRHAEGMH
jgi:hypothetical protein